jgi:hypothetical protein
MNCRTKNFFTHYNPEAQFKAYESTSTSTRVNVYESIPCYFAAAVQKLIAPPGLGAPNIYGEEDRVSPLDYTYASHREPGE